MKGQSRQEQGQWLKPHVYKSPTFLTIKLLFISSPCPRLDRLRPSDLILITVDELRVKLYNICQIHVPFFYSNTPTGIFPQLHMSQRHQSGGTGKQFWLLIDSVCVVMPVYLCILECSRQCEPFVFQVKHDARPFLPNTLYLSNLVTRMLHLWKQLAALINDKWSS